MNEKCKTCGYMDLKHDTLHSCYEILSCPASTKAIKPNEHLNGWKCILDELPKIPDNRKKSVKVLVAAFDPIYEETNPNNGYSIVDAMWMKPDGEEEFWFYELCFGSKGTQWVPIFDDVTHWQYYPEPPNTMDYRQYRGKKKAIERKNAIPNPFVKNIG